MLGGSLQLITSGWAETLVFAMAPDASLAAVASTIITYLGCEAKGGPAIALPAVPLCYRPCLVVFVRTATVFISHIG